MKHVLLAGMILVLCAAGAFAADFAPARLSLGVNTAIQYDFDGTALEVPVQVSGTPALVRFFVYTKDMADKIEPMQNGYLGWHFVNKVDTCIYMGDDVQLDVGSNTITWDGKDNDGNMVPAGEYTYYLWGYDNQTARPLVSEAFKPGQNDQILEIDETGAPLANPIYVRKFGRWTLGNDPADTGLLETTSATATTGFGTKNHFAIQKDDWNMMYVSGHNKDASIGALFKFSYVPNGESVLETDWGEDGAVTWTQPQFYHQNAVTDGNYVYVTANTYKEQDAHNELWVVDYEEGELLIEFDIAEFWTDPDDLAAGAQMSGGPGTMSGRDHLLFLGCHCSCMRQVIDPMRGLEDEEDLVVYVNNNGDYVMDHNFEEDADKPWVCNDFNVGLYGYNYYSDAEYFAVSPSFDMGAVSFGLIAPDGTGVGWFAYAGETAQQKSGVLICDNGSAFDGMYTSSNEGLESGTLGFTFYAAHDVVTGTVSSAPVSVDEDAAAFSVAQNSPNPFNPSTTISFNTPDAGTVSVDVFNVAGQKIDTIANEFMNAGSHSMTWDASGFSAGVYFYTVKTGDFSKTMKMTLLK